MGCKPSCGDKGQAFTPEQRPQRARGQWQQSLSREAVSLATRGTEWARRARHPPGQTRWYRGIQPSLGNAHARGRFFLLPNRAAHPQHRAASAAPERGYARDEREDMSLIDDLVKLEEEAKELVAGADDAAKLEAARVELLGRKGRITGLMRMMGKLAPEDRPVMGKRANEMRQLIEGMLDERTTEMKAAALKHALEHDAVDITLPGIRPQIGHQHLIKQIIEEAEDIFCGIGYTVESGPMVDTSYYNFTALNAPMDHPSRSARDTFYVVDNNPGSVAHPEAHAHGESDVLLRTQTSGVQIHTMESQKPPIYMICPGTVYRPDTADACHLPQFNQIEGLVVDEGITFGDLKGTLDYFVKCMFGEDRKTRYRPHFFPFTEPSCEVDVSCHVCGGKGCNFCKHSGWIEILGCGMVDPNVLINCGIDPEKYTGFAFGIGAERVAALRYDLPDLRTLMTGDMRFLNQF